MKKVTEEMIKDFKVMKLGYDFMGYPVYGKHRLSFHHLIVPHRLCRENKVPADGFVRWNGAILVQDTSHNYLHTIERIDPDIFSAITSEMIDENIQGYISTTNLHNIDDLLRVFERDYCQLRSKKGKQLIKYEYTQRKHF